MNTFGRLTAGNTYTINISLVDVNGSAVDFSNANVCPIQIYAKKYNELLQEFDKSDLSILADVGSFNFTPTVTDEIFIKINNSAFEVSEVQVGSDFDVITQFVYNVISTPVDILGTLLAGLGVGTDTPILAANSVLTAFENLQAQITARISGSGTTNYIPKFTGASAIGNSLLFDNGTNIGINTILPSSKLSIWDAGADGLTISSFSTTYQKMATINLNSSYNDTLGTYTETVTGQELSAINTYGVNTASALSLGSSIKTVQIGAAGTYLTTRLYFLMPKSTTVAPTRAAVLTYKGQLSLGNTTYEANNNPAYNLTFEGSMNATFGMSRNTLNATQGADMYFTAGAPKIAQTNINGGNFRIYSGISTGTGTSNILFFTASAGVSGTADNTPTEKMRIDGAGNVGIGITAPTCKLHIKDGTGTGVNAGVVTLDAGVSSGQINLSFADNGTIKWSIFKGGENDLHIWDSTYRVTFKQGGNVLIGTTTDGMTAGGSLAIAKDFAHRGTYFGAYNVTPITKPANTVAINTLLVNLGFRASGGYANFDTTLMPRAGTASANTAPIKFTSGPLLATPENGTIEYYDDRFWITNIAHQRVIDRTSDVKITTTTVTNTVIETLIYTAPIDANSLKIKNIIKLYLYGVIDEAAVADAVTIRVYMGGVLMASIVSPATGVTAKCWKVKGTATVRTIGITASMAWDIDMVAESVTSNSCGVSSFDSTVANDITVTAQWNNAKVGNIFTCEQGFVNYKH